MSGQITGALEYEIDGYVPTGERKQGAFGAEICRKRGSLGVRSKKMGPFFRYTFSIFGVI